MKAILHGTWIVSPEGVADDLFFVWAERAARPDQPRGSAQQVQRHPYAATTIEIADLLAVYVPDTDWRRAERLTRVALLPSTAQFPLMPRWLADDQEPDDAPPQFRLWRIEGIGIPILQMLDVLAALPLMNHSQEAQHRLGVDLRYWGLAAKFGLELLARERFLPGMRLGEGGACAVWLPVLDDAEDRLRFDRLAQGMPPACRAVFRERARSATTDFSRPTLLLESFLAQLMDRAVREWARLSPQARLWGVSAEPKRGPANSVAQSWWQALWAEQNQVALPPSKEREMTRFYQAWQGWTYRAPTQADATFRLCLRLEPPTIADDGGSASPTHWTLRYFLQAQDDPSLLVPAREVWRERGDVLSYLNRRFDRPQEKLLSGLGAAARLCPPIQRSLKAECPEAATLSPEEAFTFLRETARLLEGSGFGVLVPPWWNRPDARLQVRLRFQMAPDGGNSAGGLGMNSLVSYDWELALGQETLTREEFERLAALKMPLVQVRGQWVMLQPDQVEAAIAFWEKQKALGELTLRDALGLILGEESDVEGLPVHDVTLDDKLERLVKELAGDEALQTLPSPGGFVGELRPYQLRGYSWLAYLRRWGLGACLADDMGLGKTIQTIALLLHEREKNPQVGPALVICPTSVVGNWRREVERFAPTLRVMVHHGSGRAEGSDFVEQSQAHDFVISTYGLARRDLDDLSRVRWSHIILDEAQNIKNPLTKQARAVRQLGGDCRIALTGTPIENRLSELWSIMAFLNPGYLGSLEHFRRAYALPIERYQDRDASDKLRRLVRPFILRRLKTDPKVIQDLPDKFEYKVYCHLTREQATLYEAVVRDALTVLQSPDQSFTGIQRRGMVLAMLTRLKQVCNHPALFLGDGSEMGRRSGKLNRLCEMLEEVLDVGDRALVFTQFAQMGHLLQRHLQHRFGQEVLFLHGGTPQHQRERMLERFQDDPHAPSVFVLSLKAGGTGLNLMRANHVFHYDRWWNPAVENQATDRAYRIGQTRDVQVQKMICLGTLEEKIDALIESKRALAESVVGAGEDWLTELSTDELRDLITLRTEAVETE